MPEFFMTELLIKELCYIYISYIYISYLTPMIVMSVVLSKFCSINIKQFDAVELDI